MFYRITPAKGLVRLLAGTILLAAALWGGGQVRAAPNHLAGYPRVVDGDTLAFGTVTVRLAAIDAPEREQHCLDRKGKPYPCGQVAQAKLRHLIGSRRVLCRWQSVDKYRRPLARCWIERRGGRLSINRWMVQWGWALAYGGKDFLTAQSRAQMHKRGLWQGLHRKPWRWRAARR